MRRDTIEYNGEKIEGAWVSPLTAWKKFDKFASQHFFKCYDTFSTPKSPIYEAFLFFGDSLRAIKYKYGETKHFSEDN